MAMPAPGRELEAAALAGGAAGPWRSCGPATLREESAQRVIENLGVGILVVEGDLRAAMVNAEFERLTGRMRGEILDSTRWMDFILYNRSPQGIPDGMGFSSDNLVEIEAQVVDRSGTVKDLGLKFGLIPHTHQCVLAFYEITGRKRAERELLAVTSQMREEENVLLRSSLQDRYRFGRIIGKSPAMQRVYEEIVNAAATDANLIITGESGTGKELVARTVHELSARRSGSIVPVNCGAIPETLMESEFFGYRKGAFTGATIDKHGFLDLAGGGTLFLDELGELGQGMQVKLLRAIDGGGFSPLGCSEVKMPDFRIMAATNRNLSELMQKGVIREDFYYRIHVIPIRLPPLRERREDIPLLAENFVAQFDRNRNKPPITMRIMAELQAYDWPGNVRELQNTIYRYLTLKKLEFAGAAKRPAQLSGHDPDPFPEAGADLDARVARYEKQLIQKSLEQHRWHREATAEALKIHRKTLFTKMKKYGLTGKGDCA